MMSEETNDFIDLVRVLQDTPTPTTHTTPEQEYDFVSYELYDNGMGVYGMDVKSDYILPVYTGDLK